MENTDHEPVELTERQRELFSMLSRESDPHPATLERTVGALRRESFLRPQRRAMPWMMQLAAAIVLSVVGGMAGAWFATRNSPENMLARDNLTPTERVLLLQRAGAAYVRAAHAYATASSAADSTAAEVATQVLLGAAQALVRNNLDAGVAAPLATVLQLSTAARTGPPSHIWY